MLRKVLFVLGLLALILATMSPALAQQQAQADPDDLVLTGKAFQGTFVSRMEGPERLKLDTKYGEKIVDVEDATLKVPNGIAKRVAGAALEWDDLKAGDRLVVKLVNRPEGTNPLVARSVHLIPGQTFIHFTGTITNLSGTTMLTVQRGAGEEKSFEFVASTNLWVGKQVGAFEDLEVGQKVTVVARANNDDALTIFIRNDGNHGNSDAAKAEKAKGNNNGADDDDDDEDDADDEGDDGGPNPKGKALGLKKQAEAGRK